MISEGMNLFLIFLSAMIVKQHPAHPLHRPMLLLRHLQQHADLRRDGLAVIFVMIMATTVSWLVYHYLLIPSTWCTCAPQASS